MFITRSLDNIVDDLLEKNCNSSKKILQIHPMTRNFVIWNSATEAAIMNNFSRSQISLVCSKKEGINHAGGYYWYYLDDFIRTINNEQFTRCYPEDSNNIFNNKFKCDILDLLPGGNLSNYIQPCLSFLPNELVRDIKNYEKLYQSTDFGRIIGIRNYPYMFELKYFKDKDNYHKVSLFDKNGIQKHFFVHRLVAQAFIPNPLNLPCINHKDGNPSNNCVWNLEWCTVEYNNNYGNANIKRAKSLGKAIEKYDLITKITIEEFWSIAEAERQTNINQGHISEICRGERNSAGGYGWRFKEIITEI